MADERPFWRQAFDVAESAVAPRVDGVVQSEPFQIAVGLAAQARKAVQGRAERTMRRALHTWNLPAGSDVTRILNELGRLQRDVRALARRVEVIAQATEATATTRSVANEKSVSTRAGSNGAAGGRPPRSRSTRR